MERTGARKFSVLCWHCCLKGAHMHMNVFESDVSALACTNFQYALFVQNRLEEVLSHYAFVLGEIQRAHETLDTVRPAEGAHVDEPMLVLDSSASSFKFSAIDVWAAIQQDVCRNVFVFSARFALGLSYHERLRGLCQ